jgi:N-acetylneuraminic acid mutarotase
MFLNLDKCRHLILMVAILTVSLVLGCSSGDAMQVSSLLEGRWGHTATLLEDGRLLVVGGKEKPYGSLGTAEIFDPSTNEWSSAGSTLEPRGEGHTATLLDNGVLITGGTASALAEIYDFSTDQWSPAGTMMNARLRASATLLEDGRVLVAGGEDATVTGSKLLASAEIYDPSTGEWTATGSMNEAHSGHSTALLNGKPFLVGRYLAEVYDPSTETWSSAGQPVRERRFGSTATAMENGTVLVTGGEWHFDASRINPAGVRAGGTQGGSVGPAARLQVPSMKPLSSSEVFDPITSQWTSIESMSEPRANHSAILLDDGRLLVVGGGDLEAYDPDSNTWSSIGKLNQEHGESYTATLLNDGSILIVGGKKETQDSFGGLKSAEIYSLR